MLAALALAGLIALAGCGDRAASQQEPPPEEGGSVWEAVDYAPSMERFQQGRDSWDDRWAEVADSGAQLGFLPEGTAEGAPLTDALLAGMEDRLLLLCGDTAEAGAQLEQIAAAAPETAGDAAALFAQSCFALLQPRAEAVAWQYVWGVAVPYSEAWQRRNCRETEQRPAAFLDARITELTPGGVFSRGERTFLVYTLAYVLLPEPETAVTIMGGMGLREDGWLELGLPNVLAVSLEENGALSLAFSQQTDILPDNKKLFRDDFGLLLTYAEDGVGGWTGYLKVVEALRTGALWGADRSAEGQAYPQE